MTDEFYFFSNDCNNWNYNPHINTPNADPYNLKGTINISSNNSYNMYFSLYRESARACVCYVYT